MILMLHDKLYVHLTKKLPEFLKQINRRRTVIKYPYSSYTYCTSRNKNEGSTQHLSNYYTRASNNLPSTVYTRSTHQNATNSSYNNSQRCCMLSSMHHSPQFTSIEEEIKNANKVYNNKVIVKSANDLGWGVYALKTFHKGEVLFSMNPMETSQSSNTATSTITATGTARGSHTVQFDWDKHAIVDLPGRLVNHSCDANCGISDNQHYGAYDLVALRTIQNGEQISIDYETFEYEISSFEECRCGAKTCRRLLGGYKKHGKMLEKKYGRYIANYLKKS